MNTFKSQNNISDFLEELQRENGKWKWHYSRLCGVIIEWDIWKYKLIDLLVYISGLVVTCSWLPLMWLLNRCLYTSLWSKQHLHFTLNNGKKHFQRSPSSFLLYISWELHCWDLPVIVPQMPLVLLKILSVSIYFWCIKHASIQRSN